MKAVILAGGLGTRLRPVTGEHPKPMVPMLGRPMMEHIVDLLRACGYTRICAALHYRAGEIMAHFGDGRRFGVELEYRIETENLGTAGSVKNCRDFYGDEDFLVISGDAACDYRLDELMQAHRERGAAVTIALSAERVPLRYGLAVTDGDGRIRSFLEKPAWPRVVTDLVNTGIAAEYGIFCPERERVNMSHDQQAMMIWAVYMTSPTANAAMTRGELRSDSFMSMSIIFFTTNASAAITTR